MSTVNQVTDLIAARLRDASLSSRVLEAVNWSRRWLQRQWNWSWNTTSVGSIRTLATAAYTTVAVTSGSATVTVDSNDAAQQQLTTDVALGVYHFATFGGGGNRFYRITNRVYAAPTATLTITPAFIGTSSAAETMTLYFREYVLPEDLVQLVRLISQDGVPLLDWSIDDLWYLNGRPTSSVARPVRYALRHATRAKVVLDPIPDAVYAIHFEYIPVLANVATDGTEASLTVPARWHHVLEELGLWYLRRDYKDDDRWPEHERLAREFLAEMIQEEVTRGRQGLPVIQAAWSRRGYDRARKADTRGGGWR